MRFRRSTVVVFLLSSLLLTNSAALAGPKEDVASATMKWGETLGQNDPDKIILHGLQSLAGTQGHVR
jgi:hypothetical protein